MNEFDKRVRRSALKLIAVGAVMGFLLGLAVGATVTYYNIERTVVISLSEGIKT